MSVAKLGVNQPVLANMIAITAVLMGLFAYIDMPKRHMPIATINIAVIQTFYPGASPDDVDRLVSAKIREEISDLDHIKEVTTQSVEGISTIFVEYNAEVEDFGRVMIDLAAEIDKVKGLPATVDPPQVEQARFETTAIYVGVWGRADEIVMREIALDLRDELARAEGVSRAEFMAWQEREVWVELDPQQLEGHGLAPDQISQAIADENRNIPGGALRSGSAELLVRTMGEFESGQQIGELVVYRDDQGAAVRVNDLARVSDTLEEPTRITRLNGHDALVLRIYSTHHADAFKTVKAVHEVVEQFQQVLPVGVELTTFLDSTESIRESLLNLVNNALFGLLLVGLILWLFMGFRSSAMAVVGLPVAILGGVAVLSWMGASVNRMTLFAMILILGILVDDAIVVIENIQRHVAMKKSRLQAAIDGTDEVFWPVLSATATTVAAFSSLFMVTGILGEFFANIPKVVISALAASLVEALFILPSHMAKHGSPRRESGDWRSRMLLPLQHRYLGGLQVVLRHRYLSLLAALGAAGLATLLGALFLDIKLTDQDDPEVLEIRVEMPPGTRLPATGRVMQTIDERLTGLPSELIVDRFSVTGFARGEGTRSYSGTQWGQFYIFLTPRESRDVSGWQLLEEIRDLVQTVDGPVSTEVVGQRSGPPTGAPVAIQVRGNDVAILQPLAERIKLELESIAGVEDIRLDFIPGKKELQIRVDRDAAALVGLSNLDVANYVRTAYAGTIASVIKSPRGEIDVRVKFADHQRDGRGRLESLMIRTQDGRLVALREIASIEERVGDATVNRVDGKRTITVLANVDEDQVTGPAANLKLLPLLDQLRRRHPGYLFKAGGEFEMTQESVTSMTRAMLISVVVIFAILGAQFRSYIQPAVVMSALPFSFIGVIIGLIVSDVALSLLSMMGVIALAGIVVNDSLVMVDFINSGRMRGEGRWKSVLNAGHKRMRPVILTTITTMGGLLPLAYSFFGRDELLGPMAVSIVWGVSVATLLTLFLVPALYAIVDDIKIRVLGDTSATQDDDILSQPVDQLIEQLGGDSH